MLSVWWLTRNTVKVRRPRIWVLIPICWGVGSGSLRLLRLPRMETGVRFAASPTPPMRLTLAQWMGCQRSIYNAKVGEANYFRTFQRKALALTGIYPPADQQYSHFKDRELTPWLYDVPSEILRNGAVRYQQAWSRYQKRLAARPRHKQKCNRQSVWPRRNSLILSRTGMAGIGCTWASKAHLANCHLPRIVPTGFRTRLSCHGRAASGTSPSVTRMARSCPMRRRSLPITRLWTRLPCLTSPRVSLSIS